MLKDVHVGEGWDCFCATPEDRTRTAHLGLVVVLAGKGQSQFALAETILKQYLGEDVHPMPEAFRLRLYLAQDIIETEDEAPDRY